MNYRFLKPTTLKAPFGWVGGKSKLAKDIVALMPPHNRYIEVFGGGLSVLYAKPRVKYSSYAEIINDFNSDLINLHRIIKTRPKTFSLYMQDMLFSRELLSDILRGGGNATQ